MIHDQGVGDHDFTKFSLIPSVAFIIDIPAAIDGFGMMVKYTLV